MNLPPQPYHTPTTRRTTTPRNSPAPLRATHPPRASAATPPPTSLFPLTLIETSTSSHHTSPAPFTELFAVYRPATAPASAPLPPKPIRWNSQKNQHTVAPTPNERHHPHTICNRATDTPHWTHPHSSVASARTNPCTRITNPATCHTHKTLELYTH